MSHIIVSPFSNSDIRDWPIGHFSNMIGHLLERIDSETRVIVTGAPNQRLRANEVVRAHSAIRVVNGCGHYDWSEVVALLHSADCMIGNNSGLAHLGGYLGIPTVCVFGGSHQRAEWRPLGSTVVLVTRSIGCSPCHLDHAGSSPYAKACLREIEPTAVAEAAVIAMQYRFLRNRVDTHAQMEPGI